MSAISHFNQEQKFSNIGSHYFSQLELTADDDDFEFLALWLVKKKRIIIAQRPAGGKDLVNKSQPGARRPPKEPPNRPHHLLHNWWLNLDEDDLHALRRKKKQRFFSSFCKLSSFRCSKRFPTIFRQKKMKSKVLALNCLKACHYF